MKQILFILFLFISAGVSAQTWDKASVESRLCREWNVEQLVIGGETVSAADAEMEGQMTFNKDHTATNSEDDEKAEWSYDEAEKGIWMMFPGEGEKVLMKIKVLDAEKLIFEIADEEGSTEMHLSAVK